MSNSINSDCSSGSDASDNCNSLNDDHEKIEINNEDSCINVDSFPFGFNGLEVPRELDDFRRVLTPLSKDQLIELLASACISNQDVLQNVLSVICESRSHRRLYIKNLPFSACTESVIELFSQFGDVEEGIVLKKDGKSRGYAFITFKTIESAQLACKNSVTMSGRVLMVKLAADPFPFETKRSDVIRRKLFVRNLGFETNEDSLSAVLGKYGELEESVILRTRRGESKGYGFVTFVNTESTMKALQQPHHLIDGRLVFVHQAVEGKVRSSKNRDHHSNSLSTTHTKLPSNDGKGGIFDHRSITNKDYIDTLRFSNSSLSQVCINKKTRNNITDKTKHSVNTNRYSPDKVNKNFKGDNRVLSDYDSKNVGFTGHIDYKNLNDKGGSNINNNNLVLSGSHNSNLFNNDYFKDNCEESFCTVSRNGQFTLNDNSEIYRNKHLNWNSNNDFRGNNNETLSLNHNCKFSKNNYYSIEENFDKVDLKFKYESEYSISSSSNKLLSSDKLCNRTEDYLKDNITVRLGGNSIDTRSTRSISNNNESITNSLKNRELTNNGIGSHLANSASQYFLNWHMKTPTGFPGITASPWMMGNELNNGLYKELTTISSKLPWNNIQDKLNADININAEIAKGKTDNNDKECDRGRKISPPLILDTKYSNF